MSSPELTATLAGARVLFTSRAEGNLSSVGGDGAADAPAARERVRRRAGLRALVRGYQVHGVDVQVVDAAPERDVDQHQLPRADGQATAALALGVMVLTADCLPVALGCDGAVAMLHAGWRGLAAGVLERGVAALRALAGPEAEIAAAIGPGAGVCCYEVGAEVHAAFGAERTASAPIDLRALARSRLLRAGVGSVLDIEACTICDERFFSHRREGARAGRQAGVAWLS